MWLNPRFPADLVTFTEEILNGKLYFLCSVSKTNSQHKTQTSIVQELDIQNNKNTSYNRNTLTTAEETTSERDYIKYKEMQEQIKTLTSEVTKLKHRESNKEQQSPSKNHQEAES